VELKNDEGVMSHDRGLLSVLFLGNEVTLATRARFFISLALDLIEDNRRF
jgi:hypothetical protein